MAEVACDYLMLGSKGTVIKFNGRNKDNEEECLDLICCNIRKDTMIFYIKSFSSLKQSPQTFAKYK